MATYVLVHGGFVGSWCWRRLQPYLGTAHHEVFTPTLTGLGERSHLLNPEIDLDTHVQDVVNVFDYEELQDVILVGHSSSGMVIAGVADRVPRKLKHVVYFDAIVPRNGEAMMDLVPASFAAMIEQLAQTAGAGWQVPPLPLEAIGVTAEEDVRWMQAKRGAHPVKTVRQPIQLASDVRSSVPHTFIYCNQPAMGIFEISAQRAQEEGWAFRELPAPHAAMVTHPQQAAELLLGIAGGLA